MMNKEQGRGDRKERGGIRMGREEIGGWREGMKRGKEREGTRMEER